MFVEIELLRPHPSGVRCSALALSRVNIDGSLHPAGVRIALDAFSTNIQLLAELSAQTYWPEWSVEFRRLSRLVILNKGIRHELAK